MFFTLAWPSPFWKRDFPLVSDFSMFVIFSPGLLAKQDSTSTCVWHHVTISKNSAKRMQAFFLWVESGYNIRNRIRLRRFQINETMKHPELKYLSPCTQCIRQLAFESSSSTRSFCNAGNRNAIVFPVPVWACKLWLRFFKGPKTSFSFHSHHICWGACSNKSDDFPQGSFARSCSKAFCCTGVNRAPEPTAACR